MAAEALSIGVCGATMPPTDPRRWPRRWILPSPVARSARWARCNPSCGAFRSEAASRVGRFTTCAWCAPGLVALGVAPPVAEFVLGHLPPHMTRTYDRHEPIAPAAVALEAWARRIESCVSPEPAAGEVVPFGRRARQEEHDHARSDSSSG